MLVTRRRFIAISAAAGGLPLLPIAPAHAAAPFLRVWTGTALGCDATVQIHHPDPATADRLIEASLAEVRRLEAIMSLYRTDSALSRLNREGVLDNPPLDLVRVLSEARRYSIQSGGAFDVTVQPLWDLYASHFYRPDASPEGPPPQAIAETVARVGHEALEIDPARLRFAKPGMGVTLNGIGQGYITDRIVELLTACGVEHALVDMGKTRAIGGHPSGGPWLVGLEDPRAPGLVAERIPLADRAVATAGGYGTLFDAAGRFNHIFEPWSGRTSWRWLSVSVESANATEANALSNAFALMPEKATTSLVRSLGLTAHFVRPDGSRMVQRA
jgi:thiamine biosynthesis lipoprotein